jgi:hypothetical protein
MLIKRIDEVDPICCPRCGGEMKVVAFIEPQADLIEKILRNCVLWQPSTPRPPPDAEDSATASEALRELTYVDGDTFWATF